MTYFLIELFANILTMGILAYYLNELFTKKNISTLRYFVFFSVLVVCRSYLSYNSSFNLDRQTNLYLNLGMFICFPIFTKLCYRTFVPQMIFFITKYSSILILTEILSFVILRLITSNDYRVILTVEVIKIIQILIRSILLSLILELIMKPMEADDKTNWHIMNWGLMIVPLTTIFFVHGIYTIETIINDYEIIFFILILLVSNLIVCEAFLNFIKLKNLELDNQNLINREASDELYFSLKEEKFELTKAFIHDFKKHINILSQFMKENHYVDVKEYLNDLKSEFNSSDIRSFTNNKMIDLVLNTKKGEVDERKIKIDFDINDIDLSFIRDMDFNIMFSNILDNAIESCGKTENKKMTIKLNVINEIIVLQVINSCTGTNKHLHTMKNDNEFHGYGIKNVKRIALKYDGYTLFEYKEEYHLFFSTLFLPTIV